MKKSIFFVFIIAIAVLPCFAQAGDLNTAAARANEARTKAGDFEGYFYLPARWNAAETLFATAEAQKTPAAYNAAADAFDSVFNQTIPLNAKAREDEIMALRGNLIRAGIRDTFPEYLLSADRIALKALEQYEGKDYYSAKKTADEALLLYQVLANITEAGKLRQEIKDSGFESFDQGLVTERMMVSERSPQYNYTIAGNMLSEGMNAHAAENYFLAWEKTAEALLKYRLVQLGLKRHIAVETIKTAHIKINESEEVINRAQNILKGESK